MTEGLFIPSTQTGCFGNTGQANLSKAPRYAAPTTQKASYVDQIALARLGNGQLKPRNWRIHDCQRHSQSRSLPIESTQTPRLLP